MAGLMQWFQVTCPKCTGALQVRLPEGVTSVQCSQCKAVFAVQVQPIALTPPGGPQPIPKRSRKRKKDSSVHDPRDGHIDPATGNPTGGPPRALSAYNVFMKGEVARVKTEHPELPHREAFKLAAERWQASPMNPQNGGDRFPLKHVSADDGGGGGGAHASGSLADGDVHGALMPPDDADVGAGGPDDEGEEEGEEGEEDEGEDAGA